MKKLLLVLLLLPVFVKGQIITTFACNGGAGNSGDGGLAILASIDNPCSIALDHLGNFYIATGSGRTVRKINTSGIISTVAGVSDSSGYSGDGGPATAAKMTYPGGVAVDSIGNLYILDLQVHVVRKVSVATGIITTVAGNGTQGYSGDSGPASAAMLNAPQGICLDRKGNIYIADGLNNRVRKVNVSGVISTFAGDSTAGYNGDGGRADTSELAFPTGVFSDNLGNIFISDNANYRIRKVDTNNIITTIAGNGACCAFSDTSVMATSTSLRSDFITVDAHGNLYTAASEFDPRVMIIDNAGLITNFAGFARAGNGYSGDGGPATSAKLHGPAGLVTDSCGNLYICDNFNHRIRKVTLPSCGLEVPITAKPNFIALYPSPASQCLTITSAANIIMLSITNLAGQTVYSHEYNTPQVQVDVADLPAGLYFVRINGTEVRRFVKQ